MAAGARRWGAGLALALGLAACEPVTGPATSPKPPERTTRLAPVEPVVRSARSLELERYYGQVQNSLLGKGLLRIDGGGPDTPYGARQLTENFVRIALFDEYTEERGSMVQRQTESALRRWKGPVRLQLAFGPTVPEEKVRRDRAALDAYARRLARATGHPISTVNRGGNFHVLVLHEGERRGYGEALRQLVPGIGDTAVRTITDMPRSTFCLVFAFSNSGSHDYVNAIAVIRAEHPDLLRLSCLHEEVAQGLGLANDSPRARPSIFNDDEEFALLTRHDELLLRMLYDRRLKPGMTGPEAGPVANAIAKELAGGAS